MTLRLKSALQRTGSIKRPSLANIRHSIITQSNDDVYSSNEYIHKSFFDDDNYQSILKCLNGGYEVAQNLISYMEDDANIHQNTYEQLNAFSSKWNSKISQQSTLSSYNTTKRTQLEVVAIPQQHAELQKIRYEEIRKVIIKYRTQVDRMYPSERLGTVHKHYKSNEFKKSFKDARSAVEKVAERLQKLRNKEKEAKDALRQANIQCQNLSLNPTTSEDKLTRAKDTQRKRDDEFSRIQNQIEITEKELKEENATYQTKALNIYQQCRKCEEERLNQIRDILIEFTKAAYSTEDAEDQTTIFEKILNTVKTDQNTFEDLEFWARIYQVIPTKDSQPIETNDENNNQTTTTTKQTTTKKSENRPTTTTEENDEEQPTKTKNKKNKNSTPTEKKSETDS